MGDDAACVHMDIAKFKTNKSTHSENWPAFSYNGLDVTESKRGSVEWACVFFYTKIIKYSFHEL